MCRQITSPATSTSLGRGQPASITPAAAHPLRPRQRSAATCGLRSCHTNSALQTPVHATFGGLVKGDRNVKDGYSAQFVHSFVHSFVYSSNV